MVEDLSDHRRFFDGGDNIHKPGQACAIALLKKTGSGLPKPVQACAIALVRAIAQA